jgi:hypothetical protein
MAVGTDGDPRLRPAPAAAAADDANARRLPRPMASYRAAKSPLLAGWWRYHRRGLAGNSARRKMSIEQRKLLMPVNHIERIVDIKRDASQRRCVDGSELARIVSAPVVYVGRKPLTCRGEPPGTRGGPRALRGDSIDARAAGGHARVTAIPTTRHRFDLNSR